MAYDLRASMKLTDEFTSPMRKILRMFDQLDAQMRQTDRAWDQIGTAAQQAANQVNNFGSVTQQSVQDTADLQRQLELAREEAERLADAGGGAGGNLDDLGNSGQNAGNKITGAFKTAIGVLASFVAVDQIKELGVSMIESAGSAKAMEAQFSEVFKGMEDEAGDKLTAISGEATILENRMKGSFTKIAAFAKTGGMDTAESLDLADRSMRAVADSAAFYDRSLEDTTESLQSFLKGNFENDAALGLSATETTRNIAANREFGKSFKDLDESQKQLTLLSMVEEANKVGGAMGQAARESDGLENVIGNLKQSWEDFKAASGEAILGKAIESMKSLTEWIQQVDAQKVADGLIAVGNYLSDTFSPIVSEVKDDMKDLWEYLNRGEIEGGLQDAFSDFQTGMQWVANHWEGMKTGLMALTAGFVAYKGVLAGMVILDAIKKLQYAYTTAVITGTTAQWALNGAMALFPGNWIALAIGGVVAAGVLLWKNWDTVRSKTEALWDKLGAFEGVANFVLGPLGLIIRSAITIADEWDNTKSVWSNVWGGIVKETESSVNTVVDSINWLIEKINQIPGVNIPIIPKVNWTGVETTQSSRMTDQMSYAEAVHGSHATGLASVPFDNYNSLLHKDEAVLTANQAGILRGMGILKSSGNKPVIDGSALSGMRTGTGRTVSKTAVASTGISIGSIQVIGHNKPTEEITSEIVDKIKVAISNGALAGVN